MKIKLSYLILPIIFSGCTITMNIKPPKNIKMPNKITISKCNIDNQLAPLWTCKEEYDYNEIVVNIPATLLGQSFQESELKIRAKEKIKTKIESQGKKIVSKINILLKKKLSNKFVYLFSNKIINKIHYKKTWVSKNGNMYLYAIIDDKNYIAKQFNTYLFNNLKHYKLSPLKKYQIEKITYTYLGGNFPIKPIVKSVKKNTPPKKQEHKHKVIQHKTEKIKVQKAVTKPKPSKKVKITKKPTQSLPEIKNIRKEVMGVKKKINKSKKIMTKKVLIKKEPKQKKSIKTKKTSSKILKHKPTQIKTHIKVKQNITKSNKLKLPTLKKAPPVLKIKIEPKDDGLSIF